MDYIPVISKLDGSNELHEARLLILLEAFSGVNNDGCIEGLTKLAKLDFLLRYPVYLNRALEVRKRSSRSLELKSYEEKSVESKMVRYRFGPWDHRYKTILDLLKSKELLEIDLAGRTIVVKLTDFGKKVAVKIGEMDEFMDYHKRSKLLHTHFNITGTNLMKFIYDTFPEILSLNTNEEIL